MATITANIDATQTTIPVSTDVVIPGTFYTIGSEAILVHGTNRGPTGRAFRRLFWSVDRGVAGTTKASHSSGATLTQYYPDAEGGGGGGSGLPSQWTDGGSGDVTATVDDETTTALTIVKLADQTADLLAVKDDEGNVLARLRADATGPGSQRRFLELAPQDSAFVSLVRVIAPPGWRAAADGSFMLFRDEDGADVIVFGDGNLSLLSAPDRGQSEIEMRAFDALDDTSAIRSGGAGGDTGEFDRLEIVKDGDHVVQVTFAGEVGFFAATPAPQQTLARPSGDAGDLWDILAAYGLVTVP